MANAFLMAANVVGSVFKGRNLDVAMVSARVPVAIRPAVTDMSYNTLRTYGRGEFFLKQLLKSPIKVYEIQALLLLAINRLGTRPQEAHTTVNQAVTAAGAMENGSFRGLVNGVLRNYLRQQEALLSTVNEDEVARWQHPQWWLAAVRKAYPEKWQAVLAASNTHPPMSLRVNRRRQSVADYVKRLEHVGIEIASISKHGIRLAKPANVDKLPGFFDGDASVQDLGAQWAAELLDVQPGQYVLDACAAPGGKTAHVLELADVHMLALDAEDSRAARITENMQRLGLQAQVRTADCRKVETWWDGQRFDRILADVPCSASGVVRRHPDAKYLRRPTDVYSFAATQREIIDALWPLLIPGGKMLYCTCSIFPEENRQQIASFIARHDDALPVPIGEQPDLQLLPDIDHDGFYYAILQKRSH